MRAVTHYEPFEEDQPGTPARIMTFPVEKDLHAMIEDIKQAKEAHDVVLVTIHWGIHSQRATVADYQPAVAHAAIDAGAAVVIGHHPHILKGVEIYRGRPIFYSIGNFAAEAGDNIGRVTADLNEEYIEEFEELFKVQHPLSSDGHQYSMILKCEITPEGIARTSFIPLVIAPGGEPVPVKPSSSEGSSVLQYLEKVTEEAGLNGTFAPQVDDVLVPCGY